ncbi:MAG: amino acid permease [Chloroflexi bacterium]|nr:amino acid permease [Chloroflexota bacterium]
MSKRRLRRELNLAQVVMLGAGGTIAAEIFVLTGHAAGMVGPAVVLALLAGGLLSYSIALNYSEMATSFPETGGALTYVREAWGPGLLSFLVGSLDCLSSTFYSALSAVGFAYSLQVFVPSLPIVPTALAVIGVFTVLNFLGVSKVGNTQIVLGGILLALLGIYIILGLTLAEGFRWEVFAPGGTFFIYRGGWENLRKILATIALVYNAYVGFEVIADDAEEIKDPGRNIPRGILISLTLITLIYVSAALVTLGTVPWQEVAGSETALTDAARRFLPGWGVPMMALAGMLATLTSINTAMLSATREAFTMSRDGAWPRFMSRLGRFRTPYLAILVIGTVTGFVAAIGLVDFLSYISSSGYLFVLFWASLAMVRLRELHPDMKRPFRAPFFPLTAYLAAGTCLLIVVFTHWRALLFGAGVLAVCTAFYYLYPPIIRMVSSSIKAREPAKDRILVPVANPRTAQRLVHLASILAQASEDTSICVLTIVRVSSRLPQGMVKRLVDHLGPRQKSLLNQIAEDAEARNVPLYTKMRASPDISTGILSEIKDHGDVKIILMGWPGPLNPQTLADNPVKVVIQKARTNIAVLLDRGLKEIRHILVPVGGGPHSRLALRLAYEIAEQEDAHITALHTYSRATGAEDVQDEILLLRDVIEDELGYVPANITMRVAQARGVMEGILAEAARHCYDLIVAGASEEWASQTRLFGSVDDQIADQAPCSVLLVRRYEPAAIAWIRRQAKKVEKE